MNAGPSGWHETCIHNSREECMLEAVLLISTVVFFALALLYVAGLERI